MKIPFDWRLPWQWRQGNNWTYWVVQILTNRMCFRCNYAASIFIGAIGIWLLCVRSEITRVVRPALCQHSDHMHVVTCITHILHISWKYARTCIPNVPMTSVTIFAQSSSIREACGCDISVQHTVRFARFMFVCLNYCGQRAIRDALFSVIMGIARIGWIWTSYTSMQFECIKLLIICSGWLWSN